MSWSLVDALVADKSTPRNKAAAIRALPQACELAVKFAPGIRVNAVAPGFILPPEGRSGAYLKALTRKVPLKRQGSVANVIQAVRFLLANDYVTGQTIFVDGGEHLV